MRPLSQMPAAVAAGIHTVFSDIDDTLTTDGQLTVEAYAALGRPARGRPARRARHRAAGRLVRPHRAHVAGRRRRRRERRLLFLYSRGPQAHEPPWVRRRARDANRARMARCARRILREVPGCAWPPTSSAACTTWRSTSAKTCRGSRSRGRPHRGACRAPGMTAKVSSIHVNGWFGDYDKLGMARLLLARALGRGARRRARSLRVRRRLAQRRAHVRLLSACHGRGQRGALRAAAGTGTGLCDAFGGGRRFRAGGAGHPGGG